MFLCLFICKNRASFHDIPYLCAVQKSRILLSYFLLATYLLVALHNSISHDHLSASCESIEFDSHHQHEGINEVHHEHHFHVGIFGILGQLFESIDHVNDNEDEHLAIGPKIPKVKSVTFESVYIPYFNLADLIALTVDAESLPDPPDFNLSLLQQLIKSDTPLRAPPLLV